MQIQIYGDIIGGESERWSSDDVTPSAFSSALRDIGADEDLTISINSCGGDVTAGMAIVAAIGALRTQGHRTRAVVEGLAASMASVIACACDEIHMHGGAMLMVHNPWTLIQGDAPELQKQIEVLEKMKAAMVSIYRTKFDMAEDGISRLMDEETWISTDDIGKYKLRATVIDGTARIAASVTKAAYYAHIKRHIRGQLMDEDDDKKKTEDEQTEDTPADPHAEDQHAEEQVDTSTEDKPVEEKPTEDEQTDKPTEETVGTLRERIAELERENEELHRQIDAPVEDRVRGMQSRMQMQINAQKTEFENQLQARAEELTKAQAEVTSLRADLEKVKGELQTTASALDDKTRALAQLNAGVLTPNATAPTPRTRDEARRALARMPMDKRADYYKAHRKLIDG